MKLGIMQPYFVPYIGYWQLMNAVDKYIVYDDVNFIKGGWINRNRILINGEVKYFNIPMIGSSPNKLINEVNVNNSEPLIAKNIRILENAYKKAPYYADVFPVLEQVLRCGKDTISEYIFESFRLINAYLGIDTELIMSSTLDKDNSLKAQDKVLAICDLLGADEYYNTIAGKELYSFDAFREKGITLKLLRMLPVEYHQFGDHFEPNLSMIDVLMFNSKETIRGYLEQYEIVTQI